MLTTYEGGLAITPSDTVELPFPSKGISVGVAGTLTVICDNGSLLLIPTLTAGIIHKISVRQIKATGTSATGIIIWR